MEVEDSPLNLKNISQPITLQAHQQCRKADRLLVAGKYEEAITCHEKAAELLTEAMKTTECKQARLSMELQRDSHIKQQRFIQERLKRETRREATKSRLAQVQPPPSSPALLTQTSGQLQPSGPPSCRGGQGAGVRHPALPAPDPADRGLPASDHAVPRH
ncbi:hypothetical protein CgunFtcFv8_002350 [Champsocephalus gunnari]|uniref:Nuclear receptor-binding factor 2 MIT domain-containing protein n=1 Tax=Champsocephalus gunnari TaxID=52237 RepID=A0AAN8HBF8_CHAGU|nr:hypothetical protein CgunFtcFv8_002350 [Champsocephalus gunnari]